MSKFTHRHSSTSACRYGYRQCSSLRMALNSRRAYVTCELKSHIPNKSQCRSPSRLGGCWPDADFAWRHYCAAVRLPVTGAGAVRSQIVSAGCPWSQGLTGVCLAGLAGLPGIQSGLQPSFKLSAPQPCSCRLADQQQWHQALLATMSTFWLLAQPAGTPFGFLSEHARLCLGNVPLAQKAPPLSHPLTNKSPPPAIFHSHSGLRRGRKGRIHHPDLL